ncbi:MAG TPA: alpha/beta fold hydrolase [Pyrinomonadaceae bacterium]|nr:alpha/beta fold hydrolase [Pyrinomonadaceae bacterium]
MTTSLATPTSNWLTCPKPNPRASMRLFCFPYAGGRAAVFRTWPDELPAEIEFYAIELPSRGRRIREAPITRIEPMVRGIADAIGPLLDKPFCFFGHSMGALTGFELARLLRREGRPQPSHLFVSGATAPQIEDAHPVNYDLPEPEFVDVLRRLNGTPSEVLENEELLQLMLPTLRADFELLQVYKYEDEPPFSFPITAFGGLQDAEVSRQDLEGWRVHTAATFILRNFPGDHFFLHSDRTRLLWAMSQELIAIISRLR